MICDIYDNVEVAELIDMEMKEITWRYDYKSHGQELINIGILFVGMKQLNQSIVFLIQFGKLQKQNITLRKNIKFNILKEFIVMHILMV